MVALLIIQQQISLDETHAALDLLIAHPEWFAPLVTHVRGMDQVADVRHDCGQVFGWCGEGDRQTARKLAAQLTRS